ncbi:MAG TPA: T9SS type A sorting domain-containing protein [Bacteroidia bacterium]|nr:T9SS type A sorting domain-containing protein [Bacteroidia bacterium]
MKREKQFLIILLLLFYAETAFTQVMFQKTFGELSGSGNDRAFSVIQTNDGNYAFTGFTSFQSPVGAIYLVKINNVGDTLWTKIIGDTVLFRNSYGIAQTSDSGFIVSAYNITSPNFTAFLYFIRTDASGNIVWTKNYGNINETNIISSIQETHDGNFIAAGHSDSTQQRSLLLKLNQNGDTLWTRTYSGIAGSWFTDVKQAYDSNYIVTGEVNDTLNNGRSYVSLMKVDQNGNLLWSKMFVVLRYPIANAIELTSDGFVIAGQSTDYPTSSNHFLFLLKTDLQGNPLWCKTFSNPIGESRPISISKTLNGGFTLMGNYYDSAYATEKVLLIRTDSTADTLWTNSFTGKPASEGESVAATSDGGNIFTGFTADTFSIGIDHYYFNLDIYVVKTDSLGKSGCNEYPPSVTVGTYSIQTANVLLTTSSQLNQSSIGANIQSGGDVITFCISNGVDEIESSKFGFEIFPNPTEGKFTVVVGSGSINRIEIYNMLGEKIYEQKIVSEKTEINLSYQRAGIYFVSVRNEKNNLATRKLVKI